MTHVHISETFKNIAYKLGNLYILNIFNKLAWGCHTRKYLAPFFRRCIRKKHMDVGVGSGIYLSRVHPYTDLTLCDINWNSLSYARKNASCTDVKLLCHDITKPFTGKYIELFDSISFFNVLHCLKGSFNERCKVFDHISEILSENGIIYGATILGSSAKHNMIGRSLLYYCNYRGAFANYNDNLAELKCELQQRFVDVSIEVVGSIAIFQAKKN